MSNIKRVFLIVLDSVGAGEAPDAEIFGDVGAHTLKSAYNTEILNIPNLRALGIANIDGLHFLGAVDSPQARIARMMELSAGKDTTVGHWEIAGHISDTPLPTFPDGFPKEIIDKLEYAFGRGILCNKAYSGTAVLEDFGREHMESGRLIVYTSADSVLQIAAHTDVVPLEELYGYCRIAREIMSGEKYGVGRVIARPFESVDGKFKRTADRKDFSLMPPKDLLADILTANGVTTVAVGKIFDIFAGRGFDRAIKTHSNAEGMSVCSALVKSNTEGLCFVNLVDFDMLWGHRRDPIAYAEGLNAFDSWLGGFLKEMRATDALIITADHGCDPSFGKTTDHTREYTPCIIYGASVTPENLGTREGFCDIAATVAEMLDVKYISCGKSMLGD